jgi:uncharacterized YigZ family protein
MDDSYFTIAAETSVELKFKNSRFIGETFLVSSAEEALEKLASVKKREYAANHHCYACRVGLPKEIVFKYSDAGEPSGTAGKPIYDQLAGADVTNTLIVVTRYFGGTKLGTGGLTHAYIDTAKAALEKSGRSEHFILIHFDLTLDFGHYDRWQKILSRLGAAVVDSSFSDVITMQVAIRCSRADELKAAFIELTAGKAHIATHQPHP